MTDKKIPPVMVTATPVHGAHAMPSHLRGNTRLTRDEKMFSMRAENELGYPVFIYQLPGGTWICQPKGVAYNNMRFGSGKTVSEAIQDCANRNEAE